MRTAISFIAALLAAVSVDGAAPPPSRVAATPIDSATAVRVDGDLNDAIWQTAPAITGFRQRDPREGAAPTYETEARVAYDSTALYIAVQAFDPEPKRIVGIRTRRDEGSPSDWVSVLIDSFHDRRSAFEFAVNPAGVKQDSYWFNDTSNDQGWDAVWDVAVSRTERGWRAEFRIPFSQLRYHPSEASTFGLAIIRKIGRLNETTTWPLLAKSANGYVSSFGELTGLRLDRSPKRLEIVPYVLGDVKTQPAEPGNPLTKSTDPNGSVGVDLKYALRPGLTLTGTVNPDFGQVEADPAVVNLSAFETFFSERRPFFVEGSGIFSFDVDCSDGGCSGLFYSRRIGRTPRGQADVPAGGYSSAPSQTTILGAAKLTGRIGAFSVGALNAVTSDEDAVIVNGAVRTRQTVEPLASYSVLRARREFKNQSSLGFLATSTNRNLDAATRFLPGQAYTGGVDLDWRLNPKYAIKGYLAGSSVHGDAAAIDSLQRSNVHSFQRPDSDLDYDPSRRALNGYGGSATFTKIGGERVRFTTNVGVKSPGFEINDVGFMRRADQRSMSNWIQVRYEKPKRKYLRSFRYNLNQWAAWNYAGDRLFSGFNVNAHAVFTNNWATGSGGNINPQPFDDRGTRGGPGVYGNAQRSIWAYVESDERPAVSLGVFTFNSTDGKGTNFHDVSPSISYRPSSFLKVTGGLRFSRNHDESQWVEATDDGRYIFGRLHQQTVGLTARLNYTVTPALSIQLYAEPFVSAGDYSNFKELVNGRSKSYEGRYRPIEYGGNPDFNYRSFRTTNVLRWEYKPGSTLFVVWQQGREGSIDRGTFDFNRDFGGVFDAPARNVFLVKWAYWINP
jgi:uncharacterized protein DUF5916/cellulose/xylan binding protein with CBM9 domain